MVTSVTFRRDNRSTLTIENLGEEYTATQLAGMKLSTLIAEKYGVSDFNGYTVYVNDVKVDPGLKYLRDFNGALSVLMSPKTKAAV